MEYPIVSACTAIKGENGQTWIIRINEAIYVEGDDHHESLLHPFQAMRHGVVFDMTPIGFRTASGNGGQQMMMVGKEKIPLRYDHKKSFMNLRRPTIEEVKSDQLI